MHQKKYEDLHNKLIPNLQEAGDQAPARAGAAERAGHALLPHPPADPGAYSSGLLLGATPQ